MDDKPADLTDVTGTGAFVRSQIVGSQEIRFHIEEGFPSENRWPAPPILNEPVTIDLSDREMGFEPACPSSVVTLDSDLEDDDEDKTEQKQTMYNQNEDQVGSSFEPGQSEVIDPIQGYITL